MKKRLLPLLLSLLMTLTLAVPASAEYYEMRVGVEVGTSWSEGSTFCLYGTPASGPGWSYDGKGTLTLSSFNHEEGYIGAYNLAQTGEDFRLVLSGTNRIYSLYVENNTNESFGKDTNTYISGSGSLTSNGGLYFDSLIMNSGSLYVDTLSTNGSLVLNGGSISAAYLNVHDARDTGADVVFNGGSVVLDSDHSDYSCFSVYTSNTALVSKIHANVQSLSGGKLIFALTPNDYNDGMSYSLQNADGTPASSGKLGSSAAVTPSAPSVTFTDVPANSWFAAPVEWAVSKGITNGMGDGTFQPDTQCTRAHIITFLWRAAGSPAPSDWVQPFSDVPANQWYTDAALWAKEMGMASGSYFSPNANCTREMAVTFLYQYAGSPAVTPTNEFSDVPVTSSAAPAVAWAVEVGVTNGMGDGTFAPGSTCTRGQIATFLFRGFA